jgi:hypothetical protein
MPKKMDWGWTSYKKTGWVNKDGFKEYTAKFRGVYPATINGMKEQTIRFFSKHPGKALGHIVSATEKGAVEPISFHNASI